MREETPMIRKDIIDTEIKTPAENAQIFIHTVCVQFTVAMLIYMLFTSIFASQGAQLDIRMCWSFAALFVVTTTLQFVFFTPAIIKRMAYPLRLALFGVCLYVALAVAAVLMGWFPIDNAGYWVLFTIIFFAMLACATALANHRAKREERILNEKLGDYQKNNC